MADDDTHLLAQGGDGGGVRLGLPRLLRRLLLLLGQLRLQGRVARPQGDQLVLQAADLVLQGAEGVRAEGGARRSAFPPRWGATHE
jgi:hypothetical protein